MNPMRVYLAAPMPDKMLVRELHDRLAREDMVPTSSWAMSDSTSNDFDAFTPTELRRHIQKNDSDLRGSDIVLVLARDGVGGEMFAEAALAIQMGKTVLWCGRRILSSFRPGVVLVEDLESAFAILGDMRTQFANGYRGRLLAILCGAAA